MINIIVGAYKIVSSAIGGAVMKADAKANAAATAQRERDKQLALAQLDSENREGLVDYKKQANIRMFITISLVFLVIGIGVFIYKQKRKN